MSLDTITALTVTCDMYGVSATDVGKATRNRIWLHSEMKATFQYRSDVQMFIIGVEGEVV